VARAPSARNLIAALLVLVAAGAVAMVFVSGGKDTVSLETVAQAAEATNGAGGFKVEVNGGIESGSQNVPLKARGQLDAGGRKGRLIFDAAGLPGMSGGGQIEQIIDGEILYMKMPALTQQLGSKQEWLRIDYGVIGKELGIDLSSLQQGGNDPRQMLAQLRAVSGEVEKLGTEEVRGVETTHYKASVDLRKSPDSLPEQQREAARTSIERLIELTGSSTYPIEIWVDDDKLVRRMKIAYSFDVPGQDDKAKFQMTMDLFDFGTPVNVTPPPKEQVADIRELAQKLQAAAGQGGQGQGGQPPGQQQTP
jgi:hypothetical protein